MGSSGIIISARDLCITWAEESKYWDWIKYLDDRRDDRPQRMIEVPRLIQVWYLKIKGEITMSTLTPGTIYEVFFILMLEDLAEGWEEPVTVKLEEPAARSCASRTVILVDVLRRQENKQCWTELKVGEFTAKTGGAIVFSMSEKKSNKRKTGLLVKGAVVRSVAAESSPPLLMKLLLFLGRCLGLKLLEVLGEDISRFIASFVKHSNK